jgi:hypothetical protein
MTDHRDDDTFFDLLADGALGEEERRALLLRLDRHPDGWRRCALAFLESQAWGEAMSVPAAARPGAAAGAPGKALARGRAPLLIAAGLLASFAAGLLASGRWHDRSTEPAAAMRPEAAPSGALPVIEGLDLDRVSELPPVFTPTMTRAIERRGHVVDVSRQIVEVSIGGGRSLFIPVDELRVAAARWRL